MAKKLDPGRSSRRKRPAPLSAGSFTLDVESRVLSRNGSELCRLRPMECRLLEAFMTHPGETLTRAWLMQHVWGTDFVDDTRTLEVHVSHLRKRIGDNARSPVYLHTERGRGYRFEPDGEA
jgi:two-component system alkaline phosphatase synthesis response regulator PhoP